MSIESFECQEAPGGSSDIYFFGSDVLLENWVKFNWKKIPVWFSLMFAK